MGIGLYILIGFLVVLGLVILFVVATYNKLIVLRNRVRDQWSQIDVQLKRRFDLIPNLVETVKGYAKHEKETLEGVIQARNSFLDAKTPEEEMASNNQLSGALSRLFALAESYPDLKANASFMDLQNQLNETENKIAAARQFYNDTVLQLNNKVEMFPSNIVASMFKFKTEAFFEIDKAERENVKVKF